MSVANSITAATTCDGSSPFPAVMWLPVEVCEKIIDYIAMGLPLSHAVLTGEPHLSTLASCALVCRDWYYLTWYYLHQRVHLRDRQDVLLLSKTLHERPRLRKVVQQVWISGASPGKRQPIRHLGTFAAMLAGKTPELSRITIADADWTTGSVRIEDFGYLAVFRSVHTLYIHNVTLSSIAQLSHLISALSELSHLWCFNVECLQNPQFSAISLPLNCAKLEDLEVQWVAPAVEDLFVRISQASGVRYLTLGVDGKSNQSSIASRSQAVLDASAASVEELRIHIHPNSPLHNGTIQATIERHYNLSRHECLWYLGIRLYHPFVTWPWVPHILAHVFSVHFRGMAVVLPLRTDHIIQDLDRMLMTMEADNVLTQLDDVLQENRFSSTISPGGICLAFDHDGVTWRSGEELVGTGPTFQQLCDRWDELIRRKMPHSNRRGILTTTHTVQEVEIWRENMYWMRSSTAGRVDVGEAQPDDLQHDQNPLTQIEMPSATPSR